MHDALEDVEIALQKLAASEQPIDITRMHRVLNTCEAQWARAVEEYDRGEEWIAEGFRTSGSAIRTKCRIEPGAASVTLKLGRRLRQLRHLAAAFDSGEISRQHASVMAKAYTPERASELAEIEEQLVDVARHTTPKTFANIVRRYTDALDGDGGKDRTERDRNACQVYMAKTLDGMWSLHGTLDDEWGQTLNNALESVMGPRRKDDPRTPAQKRAAALVDLCRLGVTQVKAGNWAKPRADLCLHIDLSDIEHRTGSPDLADIIRAEAASGNGLSKATLQMLACDARIARVITDGPSQVLDVGRATHTVPIPTRRAVEAVHPTCTDPGCDVPAFRCDMHHLRYWEHGGPTDRDNLEPRCPYHHLIGHLRDLHHGPAPP